MPETINLQGKSGRVYAFTVYSLNTIFNNVGAVYAFFRATVLRIDPPIYIGQSGTLKDRLNDHHKERCIINNGANCIGAIRVDAEQDRLAIEADLLNYYEPGCNDQIPAYTQ